MAAPGDELASFYRTYWREAFGRACSRARLFSYFFGLAFGAISFFVGVPQDYGWVSFAVPALVLVGPFLWDGLTFAPYVQLLHRQQSLSERLDVFDRRLKTTEHAPRLDLKWEPKIPYQGGQNKLSWNGLGVANSGRVKAEHVELTLLRSRDGAGDWRPLREKLSPAQESVDVPPTLLPADEAIFGFFEVESLPAADLLDGDGPHIPFVQGEMAITVLGAVNSHLYRVLPDEPLSFLVCATCNEAQPRNFEVALTVADRDIRVSSITSLSDE